MPGIGAAARLPGHEANRFLAHIVSSSRDAIVATDCEGCILSWNAAAEALFGWRAGEVIGRRIAIVAGPGDTEQADLLGRLNAGETIPPFATRRLHRDGSVLDVSLALSPVLDERGAVLGAAATYRDITEQRRAEEERRTRTEEQAAVALLGAMALAGEDLRSLMEEASRIVAATLGTDTAGVLEVVDGSLTVRAVHGFERSEEVDGVAVPPDSQTAEVLRDGGARVFGGWSDFGCGMVAAIKGRAEAFGVVTTAALDHREFSPDDVNFLQAVAHVLSTALQRRQAEEELAYNALHDPLTSLPNRTLFVDRVDQALARRARRPTTVAVLFLDIDRFKLINDSFGHTVGDEVLVSVARLLESVVRDGDTVARLGGDEFVVCCEEVRDPDDAAEIAGRLCAALGAPYRVEGREFYVTASVGVAVASPGERDASNLLRSADAAMYRAKERGRARVELFDDDMRRRSVERLQLEQDLRRALLDDELEIHYQPLVSLCSDETVAVEALIRWRHPERGVVAPSEFVPVAEDSGLIVPLGAAVLERACRDIARWNAGAARPLTVGVNLSARQLSRDELADEVADVLARTGLAPEQLCLELTESTLLEDLESAVAALRRLRDLGVSIAIDDFGTGFSSLSYLTRFPVQQVKVDRTFVAGLGVDPGRTAVVTAVIGMAHALGLEVVAEGVETPEQRLELEVLGCDLGQGWHWSPALPVDELAGWLACRSAHVPK